MRPDRSVQRRHLDQQLATLDRRAWGRPRDGWLKAIREAIGMSAVELAARAGISDSRVGQIERAEVKGSLRISTMERMSAALGCRYLYVVLPDEPLEDMVLRQAYGKALEERSIPASVATDGTALVPHLEEQLEIRTLELIDRTGLWHTRDMFDPIQSTNSSSSTSWRARRD